MTLQSNISTLALESRSVDHDEFEFAEAVELSIFPNPTEDYLNIELLSESYGEIIITISNLSGEIVFKKLFIVPKGLKVHTINIQDFESGMYILKVLNMRKARKISFLKH